MKSRKFLHTNPTELPSTSPTGFLLARSSQSDVAASSAVRRFELQHNSSPRFARRRQERRKGQALLLAVLIMLLAALLSAGFLGVVSGNLNQTARIADKTRAIEASRAGIAFANAQLSGSSQGDLWRPIDVSPAPAPGATGYDFYYSQLDKVQGWSNGLTPPTLVTDPNYRRDLFRYRNVTYGKFPDPTQSLGDAPKFLVKVEELPIDPTDPYYDAAYNPGNSYDVEHAGQLKITSIGLSDDDPNVFHRSIAYKVGRQKSPWASALRSVSNWDFKNNVVPQVRVSAIAPDVLTGTTKITIFDSARQGEFPDAPFNVVLSHKDATVGNSKTFGGVVTATAPVAMSNPATTEYTIAGLIPTGFVANDTMQIAAALGTAQTIDLLNTGQAPSAGNPQTFPIQNQPDGILANGSLWLQGQIQLTSLQKLGGKIQSAGAISLLGTKTVPLSGDVTTAGDLLPSEADSGGNLFPGTFSNASGVKTDLVTDAWNKLGAPKPLGLDYSGTQTRVVDPYHPTKINGATNLARYRALTRNSSNGIYIDNRTDVEKVGTADMSQAQLVSMLTVPTSTSNFARNDEASVAAMGVSLEQRHLRGWVGPDEFMARGALVELIQVSGAVPYLRVTYDSRSDTNFNGSAPEKAFRDANGNLQPGVYTKNLDWPKNGTLFAEGNLRIRGEVNLSNLPAIADPNDFPSLTAISLGNIYIEGPLSVDRTDAMGNIIPIPNRKKLMLLAKKNVIVNPTRAVISRLDTQTLTSTAATIVPGAPPALNTVTIALNDVNNFEQGNYVVAAGTPNQIRGVVTAKNQPNITDPAGTIVVETQDTGTIAVNALVLSPLEKRETVGATPNILSYTVATSANAINRRIPTPPTASANYRLVMDHVGKRVPALKVETEGLPPGANTFDVFLSNKRALDTGGIFQANLVAIDTANKKLRANYSGPMAAGLDEFPQTYPTTQADADLFTISALQVEMNARDHPATPATDPGWKYNATIPTAVNGALPFYYLAGFGLRNAHGVAYTNTDAWRKDVKTTAFEAPLATSLRFDLNGLERQRFGFNPNFLEPTDALTVDESFYQTDADVSKNSTLDSRALPAATFFRNIVLRQSPQLLPNPLPATLPDERMRAMKLENIDLTGAAPAIRPVMEAMNIDAFVYAQEGSWLVIPGDYFRSTSPVRAEIDGSGNLIGSYIDFGNVNLNIPQPDAGEFITDPADPTNAKVADLNRNGIVDAGEKESVLRFVRNNSFQIQFTGAIVENQTAVVADVKNGANTLVNGAVQDWMNKWAAYNSTSLGTLADPNWKFINYTYDPSIANGSIGANQLRIPITDDLLYQQ